MKRGLAYLKAAVFIPMFRMIIRQDRVVLKSSHANWKALAARSPLSRRTTTCAPTSMLYCAANVHPSPIVRSRSN